MKKTVRESLGSFVLGSALLLLTPGVIPASSAPLSLHNSQLTVTVNPQSGSYAIQVNGSQAPVLEAVVGAEINHHWVRSGNYPNHQAVQGTFQDAIGVGRETTTTFSGLSSAPDLVCVLRLYDNLPYGTVQVKVANHTSKSVSVQAIRDVDAIGSPRVNLGSTEGADRFMFESFTEDPTIPIGGLDQAPNGAYVGFRDGLIYNRHTKQSLLLAALTENRFLTTLRAQVQKPPMGASSIGSFTVDSTGTTDAVLLRDEIAPAQQVKLSLPVAPGKELSSEIVMFAAGADYRAQLEAYGRAVQLLHRARVSSKPPMGWWSWTAFYGGMNEGEVLTNAKWLSAHLKSLGFNFCHLDEGYDYARGEYMTTNATQFPDGMRKVGYKITHMGLHLAVWTAPFEVANRAWVYQHHKDWLVHDAKGQPIQIGYVHGHVDPLYVLDTTNPGAQAYLRETYRVLTRQWGVRYIKLDFMDSSAIEGYFYRPHTTALEAERIGLKIIRGAVGNGVLLDKDGSAMLAPVGLVDEGRIAPDTGHSFSASRDADPNIAARFYMNRTFYISDPDAFSVSTEVEPEQSWHNRKKPLTMNEAEVQIVLAAVAGGMYDVGDDLPTLASTPARLALVENSNLLRMVELRRAATPIDLMSFSMQDGMPSEYFLKEDARQSILAIFNWTEVPRSHTLRLTDLGLPESGHYDAYDALRGDTSIALQNGSISISHQPPHSVRLIKIINTSVPAAAPSVTLQAPASAATGNAVKLEAVVAPNSVPALAYHWDFGDGTTATGRQVSHAFTRAADYVVRLTVNGVDGLQAEHQANIAVRGVMKTAFHLDENRRYVEPGNN